MAIVSWNGLKACRDTRWQALTMAILAHAALNRKSRALRIAPPSDYCYVFTLPSAVGLDEILGALGLPAAEIARLKATGVISTGRKMKGVAAQ